MTLPRSSRVILSSVRNLLIFLLLVLPGFSSAGQEAGSVADEGKILLSKTANPAVLGLFPRRDEGRTQAIASFTTGDYHRAMDSKSVFSYGGSSEGVRNIGGMRLSGTFDYTEERHEGRCWADVADPYSGNPYIIGGDIPGSYRRQAFDFSAGCASLKWDRFTAGAGIDYRVGDFSRSNDPRTRSQSADYGFKAGAFWSPGASCFGASFSLMHHKERMEKPVAKGSPLDAFKYYDYRGLADYVPVGLLLLSRRYIGNKLTSAIQYSGASANSAWFSELKYGYRHEDVVGNTGETPGDWTENEFSFSAGLDTPGWGMFRLDASLVSGAAQRTLQEQVTELNSEGIMQMYWRTLMSNVYYKSSVSKVEVGYEPVHHFNWREKLSFAWEDSYGTILLPSSSVNISRLIMTFRFDDIKIGRKDQSALRLGVALTGRTPVYGSSISLDDSLDATPVIRDNVVIPDYEYMTMESVSISTDLTWDFSIGKVPYYLKASIDATIASESDLMPGRPCRFGTALILGFRH